MLCVCVCVCVEHTHARTHTHTHGLTRNSPARVGSVATEEATNCEIRLNHLAAVAHYRVPSETRHQWNGSTSGDVRALTRRTGIGADSSTTSSASSGSASGSPRPMEAHTTPSSSATRACVQQVAAAATLTQFSHSTRFGVVCSCSPWAS